MDLPMCDVAQCAFNFECKIITNNSKTQFTLMRENYEVPFMFPIDLKDNLFLDKISNYIITKNIVNDKIKETEVRFWMCYIELYREEFEKALKEFKRFVLLAHSSDLMQDVIIKAFFNILNISVKSYNKAYNYLYHSPYAGFQGSFLQYCGLE